MPRGDGEISSIMQVDEGEPTKRIATRDVDAALKFLDNQGTVPSMSDSDEKRLLRKIDWHIMPLLTCCYFLQYLDKTLRECPTPDSFVVECSPIHGMYQSTTPMSWA